MLLMVKIHFRLTYRMLQGFEQSLAQGNNWKCDIPSYSLICKRASSVKHLLPKLGKCRSGTILIDASGAKVLGEGEWKVKIHGRARKHKWIKIHIGVDPFQQRLYK